MRRLAAVAGFAVYVIAGWVFLTYLVSGREVTPPALRDGPPAVVRLPIHVIDRPTLYCVTRADRVASDKIVAEASEIPELLSSVSAVGTLATHDTLNCSATSTVGAMTTPDRPPRRQVPAAA